MELLDQHKRKTKAFVFSVALWLLTSVLSVVTFIAGRRIFIDTFTRFFSGSFQDTSQDPLSFLNIMASFPLAFLLIAIIIGGFEYHLGSKNRAGSEESRSLFTRTLALEAGFLLLALFI